MANRFDRLFQIPDSQYIEGSPVILSAGALLKDNETGSIIAQLKFQSVSEKRIKAVKVSLSAFDISKAEVQGVSDYQYLELNIGNGQEFGGNKAIVMPVSVVRSFALSSIVVVFQDGSIWECSESLSVLPPKNKLVTVLHQSELEKQYRLNTNDHAEFCPREDKGLWQCSCGTWNSGTICTNCHIFKEKAFSSMEISALTEQMNIRLEKEKAQREEEAARQAKLHEEATAKKVVLQKRMKFVAIIAVIVALVIGILVAIHTKINELTIEKLLALYTKEDAIELLGDPEGSDTYDQYHIKFMGDEYYLLVSYKGNTLRSLSLDYSYPGMDDVETAIDLLDYKITSKDRKAAKAVIDELLDAFTEKYGDPSIFNSQVNTTTYTWTVNDRQIKVTDYTGNDDLASISAVEIDINCDHQSFCEHTDTKEEKVAATCTKDGYDRTTCNICGYVDETKHEAFGHTESAEILRESTCSVKGEKEITCSVCGNQRKEEIATIPHTYQETITKEATCTAEGSKNQTCSVCNYATDEEAIAALGHDYSQSITKSAGCDSTGTYTYTCTRCSDQYTETIEALGHSMTAATCTKDGACSRCGKKGDSAHGHSWGNDYKCIYCSASQPANVSFSADVPSTTSKDVTINSVSVNSTTLFLSLDGIPTVKVTVTITGYNNHTYGGATAWLRVYTSDGSYETSESFIILEEFSSFTETVTFYVTNGNSYIISFS